MTRLLCSTGWGAGGYNLGSWYKKKTQKVLSWQRHPSGTIPLNYWGLTSIRKVSCYATLTTLRMLKNILPTRIKTNLAQALVLSNNNISLTLGLFDEMPPESTKGHNTDILTKPKLLPVKEQREWNLLKTTHKTLHNPHWPSYLKLNVFQHKRCLRSSSSIQLVRSLISNTLQVQTVNLFNMLPSNVRCCQHQKHFF